MNPDIVLSRLVKVRSTGRGTWMACCPVHEDKTPSMTIADKDGVSLMHCFSCGANGLEIVQSLGLEPADLFPENINRYEPGKPINRPFPARDVMQALSNEMILVLICAKSMLDGKPITPAGFQALERSVTRFNTAMHVGGFNEF